MGYYDVLRAPWVCFSTAVLAEVEDMEVKLKAAAQVKYPACCCFL